MQNGSPQPSGSAWVTPERSESKTAPWRSATLQEVIATDELDRRPRREPNYRAEAEALSELARAMPGSQERIFQQLADCALRLCGAQSAGISLLEQIDGQQVFRWRATAGDFASLVGNTLPREFSPCGTVVDSGALQLMRYPVRHYTYIAELAADVHEVLLVPFGSAGATVGTVWVVAHDPETRFDAEDARITTVLSQFASAAAQAIAGQVAAERNQRMLRDQEEEKVTARTELARAHDHMRFTDARFHAFFDQAPFYAGILSREGRVSEVGKLAVEACGYTRKQVLGELFWETMWWRGSTEIQQRIQRAFQSALAGETFHGTLPYLMADGSARSVELGLSPVYDDKGKVEFVMATGTDITERGRAEAELVRLKKRLDAALLAAEIGTYEWDVTSDWLYGDRNFMRMFDVAVDEAGGAPVGSFLAVIHPDDRERVARSIRHSVETGANYEEDYRVFGPQGERWVNGRGRMTKDDQGRVVNFFGVALDITARKHAEQERELIASRLRRLTAIHETVLAATDDFAYVFDLSGRFVYANRPLLKLYGRSFDDVIGKTFSELGYPQWHADLHLREIKQVIDTQQAIQGELPFTGANGVSRVYDYIFTPVFGAEGHVEAVAGTTRDVTERKRTEERDRLLISLDDATRPLTDPRAITQASARVLGEHLEVNRCAYADVEYDENTFNLTGDFNREVPSIVGRYRFDQFGEECLRLMRAGEPYVVSDVETDTRTRAVREVYRAARIRAVICVPLHKAGRFVAAMAVHQVTPRAWLQSEVELLQLVASRSWESIERTRMVRVLAESEQRLRLALETGRLGVWELDVQTGALTSSALCKAILGLQPNADFSYEGMIRAVHPEDRPRVQEAMNRSMTAGGEFDLEYRTVWPNGSTHWVLVRGQTSQPPDTDRLRTIGVSLDITQRKETESEQVRLREEAVRASRAKDDFLATLSHELRTPLNPVLLVASDAAQDADFPPAARASFELIRKNVELEARLIDDLLDLTTIVRGKLVIRKEAVDVHTILSDAIAAVQPEFEAKRVALTTSLAAGEHTVFADEVRLVQVFINLLKNAVKFTSEQGRVELHTAAAGSGRIKIHLSDTGIGMTVAELERVFGAFEQGDHATEQGAHRFGGLGLGLAISQRLVELHGGTIQAFSEGRDRGTSFTIELPLHRYSGVPSVDGNPPLAAIRELNATAENRILLVEDHEPTRRTLAQLLRRRNYSVSSAASLAEAREQAAGATFDLVVSDLGLPDGDGTELMAELRDRFGLRGIALTGYGMEEDISRCRAAGFVAHLTKPIRVESLELALRRLSGVAER